MSVLCPHCGYNLRREEPVEDGPFRYSLTDGFQVDGIRLLVSPITHLILGSIMQAGGRLISKDALLNRAGYEGDAGANYLAVQMSHARAALAAHDVRFPIQTVWGEGFRWCREAVPLKRTRHRADIRKDAA